jgi:hypothetical protein
MNSLTTRSTKRPSGAYRWMRVVVVCLAVSVGILAHTIGAPALANGPGSDAGYRLIVNPGNPSVAIDRSFLAQAFLKKVRKWPDGETIQPVDLVPSSTVRRQYSVEVLGRSVEAVKIYWQQMIFSGRDLPPAELLSDDDVVTYVVRKPGAVGYVSAGAQLRGAKVLSIK